MSDSTTGMNAARDGICDIGMASRELKQSELDAGVKNTVIATDGIAVVVNKANKVDNLTKAQVADIFTGKQPNGTNCNSHSALISTIQQILTLPFTGQPLIIIMQKIIIDGNCEGL